MKMRIRVPAVIILGDAEAADIHIEMDVPLLEIWSVRDPNLRLRISLLDSLPRFSSNPMTKLIFTDVKKAEGVMMRR